MQGAIPSAGAAAPLANGGARQVLPPPEVGLRLKAERSWWAGEICKYPNPPPSVMTNEHANTNMNGVEVQARGEGGTGRGKAHRLLQRRRTKGRTAKRARTKTERTEKKRSD